MPDFSQDEIYAELFAARDYNKPPQTEVDDLLRRVDRALLARWLDAPPDA